ncbi:MAG: DsbA family protein, partial [Nanoarchaeota archaeon]|nr:DsbA family protein [Nanoarchaeota archaeon]
SKKKTSAAAAKVAKKSSENNSKFNIASQSSEQSNNMLTYILLVIGVLQLVIMLVLLSSVNSLSGNSDMDKGLLNMGESESSDLSDIGEQIARLDSFFANNVPGYLDGNAIPQNDGDLPENNIVVGEIDIEGEPMIGNKDAKVTIIEFSDYECPFCGRFFQQTYGQIKEDYIDTGKVNLVFKDFPLNFHDLAKPASLAANCVFKYEGDEKYFEMHDLIFSNQDSLSKDQLKEWATGLGISESDYDSCIADPEMSSEIDEDFTQGASLGVSGTPSFIVNGELIVGAQPFAVFKEAIDAALEE